MTGLAGAEHLLRLLFEILVVFRRRRQRQRLGLVLELLDRLVREQNNLTDVLRHALATGDREVTARLVALLGSLWTVTGDQPRIFAICDPAAELLTGWDVPDDLLRHAHEAAGVLMLHLSWMPGVELSAQRDLLLQGGRPTGVWGLVGHTVHVLTEPADPSVRLAQVAVDRPAAVAAALPQACVGAGTVLTVEQLHAVRDAGAQFAVSPGLTPRAASPVASARARSPSAR